MNNKQKAAFLAGVIVIAIMGLYPPWKEAGPKGLPLKYGPVFAPPAPLNPEKGMEVDFVRLFLQIGVAAVLSAGMIAAAAPQAVERPADSPLETGARITSSPGVVSRRISQAQVEASEDEEEEEEFVDDGSHILRLPSGKTYGEFLVESDEDPEYWETLCEARGVIKLPRSKRLQLEVKGSKDVDLSFVALMAPDTLFSVDLSQSTVKDWELGNLQKLTELKELDLSSTGISSQALSYLKGLDHLEKLWLDGTAVDDSAISDLQKFSSLKKLSIKDTKITKDGAKKLQDELSNCKVET